MHCLLARVLAAVMVMQRMLPRACTAFRQAGHRVGMGEPPSDGPAWLLSVCRLKHDEAECCAVAACLGDILPQGLRPCMHARVAAEAPGPC